MSRAWSPALSARSCSASASASCRHRRSSVSASCSCVRCSCCGPQYRKCPLVACRTLLAVCVHTRSLVPACVSYSACCIMHVRSHVNCRMPHVGRCTSSTTLSASTAARSLSNAAAFSSVMRSSSRCKSITCAGRSAAHDMARPSDRNTPQGISVPVGHSATAHDGARWWRRPIASPRVLESALRCEPREYPEYRGTRA